MNTSELRQYIARQLAAVAPQTRNRRAFVGLDGFVDEILHVVDKRKNATRSTRHLVPQE